MIELTALPGASRSSGARARNGSEVAAVAEPDPLPGAIHEDVRRLVGSGWVEELVVRGDSSPETLEAVVEAARLSGRRVRLMCSAPLAELPQRVSSERWIRNEDHGGSWVLLPLQRSRWRLVAKRVLDLVASGVLLVLLLPLLVVIGVAVKLTSAGPIFYHWRVLGENGRPFVGFKFRTMVRDADKLKVDLLQLNERSGPIFKISEDPRVTPMGRWLRKHSLDELPQLWSVLTGDMSLVGPRPVFPSDYKKFELWQMRKMSVKPGLTCTWQVDGRQHIKHFSDWARLDLDYIDTWSLRKDLAILLRTPRAVITGTGH